MTSFDYNKSLFNENPSFVRPPVGGLRNHEIFQQFIGNHIISLASHGSGQTGLGHFEITFSLRHIRKIKTMKYTAIIKMKLLITFDNFVKKII